MLAQWVSVLPRCWETLPWRTHISVGTEFWTLLALAVYRIGFFFLFTDANICNNHAELIQSRAGNSLMQLICPVILELIAFFFFLLTCRSENCRGKKKSKQPPNYQINLNNEQIWGKGYLFMEEPWAEKQAKLVRWFIHYEWFIPLLAASSTGRRS